MLGASFLTYAILPAPRSSARSEIRVLQEKVKDLSGRVKVLTVENESLKAEVEIYRAEAAAAAAPGTLSNTETKTDEYATAKESSLSDLFVRAGRGVYPNRNEITWKNVHGASNNLAVALSPDETVVASGGADKTLRLIFSATEETTDTTARLELSAPVISVAFASATTALKHVLACGCMDGSSYLVQYTVENEGGRSVLKITNHSALPNKQNKYVKTVSWSPKEGLLATSSADGTVHLYRIQKEGLDSLTLAPKYGVQLVESLHLQTAIEALSFTADNQLLCYARNTPHIAAFDLGKDMAQTKINLNKASSATAGGFDEHVSMAVMDLNVSNSTNHACWLAATDTARNFVLDARSNKIVRNLYGHANDGYSQPKAVWSSNGQYVLGNTQDESVVCVWDVASQQLVDRLSGHGAPVRDIYSSPTSDAVVTTAFDKTTRLWYSST